MSHPPGPPHGPDPTHTHHPPRDAAHGHDHGHGEKPHPTWKQYKWVALVLALITIVEVWIYYIPSFVASRLFVPALLIMSAVKFAIVVMFYMHLRYDHKLFRVLFTGPLLIAITSLLALLFLFGQIAMNLRGG